MLLVTSYSYLYYAFQHDLCAALIKRYKETAISRTIGYNAKAERIERSLIQVPILERINLLKVPQSKEVID